MKKSHNQFLLEIRFKHENKYEILTNYINQKVKIKVRHLICNSIFDVHPGNLLKYEYCPVCGDKSRKEKQLKRKLTNEKFLARLEEKYPNKYIILEKYINYLTPLKVLCNDCGSIYHNSPSNLLSKHSCLICAGNKKRTHNEFIAKLNTLYPNKYIIYDKYINDKTKLKVECLNCGDVYYKTPNGLLNNGCLKCSGTKKYFQKQFENKVKEWSNNKYAILGEYININTPIETECKNCGHKWKPIPYNLKSGYGCPVCILSKGELKILEYLKEYNIKYFPQETFKYTNFPCVNLKTNAYLKFDFYLPEYNLCIEYQGIQHYKPTKFSDITNKEAEFKFEDLKFRDLIKVKFCKENKIELLLISYLNFKNIENLIKHKINTITSSQTYRMVLK